MPWTVADVDRFKKGLTTEEKKRWVATANTTLQSCLDKGGTVSTCESKAIRIASGVVGNENLGNNVGSYLRVVPRQDALYEIQTQLHQGRPHIIAPVIMMVEGVHQGNHGPIYHTGSELARFPESWNGIPVVVQHPDNEIGSANTPEVVEAAVVGRVFNTQYRAGKLRAEIWLDQEKLLQVSPQALAYIKDRRPLDVSVGVFSDEEAVHGSWNGESYEGISRNYRPDHLALLPDARGACAWTDGCGVRTNEQKGDDDQMPQAYDRIKELILGGVLVHTSLYASKQGYRELVRDVQVKLNQMDSNLDVHILEEVYDKNIIYRVENREGKTPSKLFRRDYARKSDGTIEFGNDITAVIRRVDYIDVTQNNQQNKEESPMPDKGKPCCKEKVEMLIQSNAFTEVDRPWLESMDEKGIDRLTQLNAKLDEAETKAKIPVAPAAVIPAQMNKEQAIQVLKESLADPNQFMQLLPKETKAQMEHGMRLYQDHRAKLVSHIQANATAGIYSDAELRAMEIGALEKLVAVIPAKNVYSVGAISPTQAQANLFSQEEILLPPGVVAQ